jgi:hypothetical protein
MSGGDYLTPACFVPDANQDRKLWEAKLLSEGWTPPVKVEKKVIAWMHCPGCRHPVKPSTMTPSGVCELCEARADSPGDE